MVMRTKKCTYVRLRYRDFHNRSGVVLFPSGFVVLFCFTEPNLTLSFRGQDNCVNLTGFMT